MMSTRGTKYVFPLVSRCCEWCRCLYVDQKGHHCYFFPLEHGKRVVTPRRKSCSPHSISPAPQRRGVPELIQIRTRAVHDQEAWADRRHGQHSARGGHVWVRVRAVRFPQFVRSSIELTKSGSCSRECPGQQMGTKSAWIAIVRLLWAFNIEAVLDSSGNSIPIDTESCTEGLTWCVHLTATPTPDLLLLRLTFSARQR